MATAVPWTGAMPLVPLAFSGSSLPDEAYESAVSFQGVALDADDPSSFSREVLGAPERLTKLALIAMLAQDQQQLMRWWADARVRFDYAGDRAFSCELAPWAFAHNVVGPWHILPKQAYGVDNKWTTPTLQWALAARAGPRQEALEFLREAMPSLPAVLSGHHIVAFRAVAGDPAMLARLGDLSRFITPALPPTTNEWDDHQIVELIDLQRTMGSNGAARSIAQEAGRRRLVTERSAVKARVAMNRPNLTQEEQGAIVTQLVQSLPWNWTALHSRLLVLDPNHELLQAQRAALAADRTPIAAVARWVIDWLGSEEELAFPDDDFLAASRDSRFPSLVAAFALQPQRSARFMHQLSDPRMLRGWCFGPPRHHWLSQKPDERPLQEWLRLITALRLTQSVHQ
jgi:hypothetical protein